MARPLRPTVSRRITTIRIHRSIPFACSVRQTCRPPAGWLLGFFPLPSEGKKPKPRRAMERKAKNRRKIATPFHRVPRRSAIRSADGTHTGTTPHTRIQSAVAHLPTAPRLAERLPYPVALMSPAKPLGSPDIPTTGAVLRDALCLFFAGFRQLQRSTVLHNQLVFLQPIHRAEYLALGLLAIPSAVCGPFGIG